MKYNIYCDESCHLPNDKIDLMVIGGLSCPKEKVAAINKSIFDIKEKHGIYKFAEIKWTKVSESKYEMYKDLIDLFFDNTFLSFRAVVALNKSQLNYEEFNLSHDDWYQRIYFLTLREMIDFRGEYYVYADIKDTKGSEKIDTLKAVLNNAVGYFFDETVKNIQLVRSDQIQLMQLADLLIGAVAYANRGLDGNSAKVKLIHHIEESTCRSLKMASPKSESKFNIFKWLPREV
ncbi:MAG: DUF3800 domain-containing protein [Firmicutes bacterium]|nr:DUF3800 domain-containing protein [Bacillota bacterium]